MKMRLFIELDYSIYHVERLNLLLEIYKIRAKDDW